MEALNEIRHSAFQALAAGKPSYSIGLYEQLFNQIRNEPTIEDVINYGAALRQTKQLKKAIKHYKHFLPQFSENIQLIQNTCNCWIELNEFNQSREILYQALENNANNVKLLLTLGYTEISAGKTQKACKIFENIIEIDSNNFDAWFNLAVAKAKVGQLEDALGYFRQAQRLNNDHLLLQSNTITILQNLKRIEEAWRNLEAYPQAALQP